MKQLIVLLTSLMLLAGCERFNKTTHLEKIQQAGVLRVGTLFGPVTFNYQGDQAAGFDYELAKQFAEYLGVELDMAPAYSLNELFPELDSGNLDFVASGLTLTKARAEKYRSAPPYYQATQTLVYRKGDFRPRSLDKVNNKILVVKDSNHEELLKSLKAQYPNLTWETTVDDDHEELLRKVADKEVSFAIVNNTTLARNQRYYPILAEALKLDNEQPVAWLLRKNRDDSLYSALIEFLGQKHKDGTIAKLDEKYFGHVQKFDFVDTRSFLKSAEKRLPKYQGYFEKYASEDWDWLLLASISYQESHWKPDARSPTGVRGMMMLTQPTAKSVGVKNRLDPEQSIQGGAKYLVKLMKRIPDSINDGEKKWFALASYNLGFGHVMDARRLTRLRGGDPDHWADVKETLPLLQRSKWYKKTRYGYARGGEAKHYVNNIRQYQESLTWLVSKQKEKEDLAQLARLSKENSQPNSPAENPGTEETARKTEVIPPSQAVAKAEVKPAKKSEPVAKIQAKPAKKPEPVTEAAAHGDTDTKSDQSNTRVQGEEMQGENPEENAAGQGQHYDLIRNG